ncbi:MAG: hypothetical protein PHW60_09830 [Kiritimatiellae bacterium]|nr:hypothetical protein [Kiritimatiellia bacterium]
MKTQITTQSSCLAMGLLLLTACTTTKTLDEWRAMDNVNTRFGHLMVVALFRQDETRRMFENEFAWQISNMGPMVTRSYNVMLNLNENTTAQMPNIAQAVGADGILLIRMVKRKQYQKPATSNARPAPASLTEYLQQSWKDNYDPPNMTSNTVMAVESSLFDTKKGNMVWSLATESMNQFGSKWEINLLAKLVLGKMEDAMQK